MKKTLTLLFVLARLNMFAQTAEPNFEISTIESSKTWLDLDYVGDGIIGHKLDIFLPKKGKAHFPIIVTIYGSAWFSNSAKGSCFKDGFGQALLNNGFAVVSINHRSSADAVWPAQLHDIKAAIRFIRANATKFSLDSSFVGVTGFSSGGHLSTMLGVTSNLKNTKIGPLNIDLEGNIGNNPNSSSHVNAVVDWFGPTNFITMDSCGSRFKHDDIKSPESSLIGGAIQDTKDQLEIQTLEIRIREEQSRYNRELQIIQNEINDLESDYRSGESRFPSMSDYEKGQWVRKRQDLKSDIARLYRDISRKIPPSLEADLIELQGLKSREQKENVLLNASITYLNSDKEPI